MFPSLSRLSSPLPSHLLGTLLPGIPTMRRICSTNHWLARGLTEPAGPPSLGRGVGRGLERGRRKGNEGVGGCAHSRCGEHIQGVSHID